MRPPFPAPRGMAVSTLRPVGGRTPASTIRGVAQEFMLVGTRAAAPVALLPAHEVGAGLKPTGASPGACPHRFPQALNDGDRRTANQHRSVVTPGRAQSRRADALTPALAR